MVDSPLPYSWIFWQRLSQLHVIGNISMAVFFWHVPLTALLINIRNKLHLFLLDGNLYYIFSLIIIFLSSHILTKLRNMMSPKVDIFLHNLNQYAHNEKK